MTESQQHFIRFGNDYESNSVILKTSEGAMHQQRERKEPGIVLLLARLLVSCCVLIGVFAVVGYVAGWITWQHDRDSETSTIEVDTGEVKKAAEEAVEKGKALIEQTGEGLQKLKEAPTETELSPVDKDSESDPTSSDPDTTVAPEEHSQSTQPE